MEIDLTRITCANCSVPFWITESHDDRLRRDHISFYCPNGHFQSYLGKTHEQQIQEITQKKNTEIWNLERQIKQLTRKPRKSKKT